MRNSHAGIRARIAELGVRHADVANQLRMHPSALSAILRGRRRPPEGFGAKVDATLDLLGEAERAAEEARARVLAKGRAA